MLYAYIVICELNKGCVLFCATKTMVSKSHIRIFNVAKYREEVAIEVLSNTTDGYQHLKPIVPPPPHTQLILFIISFL